MAPEGWKLQVCQREETVKRTSENLFALAYSTGAPISDREAAAVAASFEEKAYTVARIESQTTTGQRPPAESLKAYSRKLAALLTNWLRNSKQQDFDTDQEDAACVDFLDISGDREFLTKTSTEKFLAPLFTPNSGIKKIKLSTKSFGITPDNSVEVAARAITAGRSTLTDVDLSDIIAGRPEAEALQSLKILSRALAGLQLKRLDLSDNALGEKGVRACGPAFAHQEALEFLAFQNVGLSIGACEALRELLINSSELRGLHFYNNMSDNRGAIAISQILQRAPRMQNFKMASSRIGADGMKALSAGLRAGQNLERLDLSDNPITEEAAEDMADLIKAQPNLKFLNLSDTSLTDEGAKVVCEAIVEGGASIEELELALNEITVEGAKVIAKAISGLTSLRKLNLRENELEDSGSIALAAGLEKLTQLESVDLVGNQIRRAGALALARSLKSCKGLQLLALDDNLISDAGIDVLRDVLESHGLLAALGSLEENSPESDDDIAGELDEEVEEKANAKNEKVPDETSDLVDAFSLSQIV